ncbi:MAG: acyl-CoA thioesterase [Alphaproteobacteria bacterium]|nr:acyl-CoA thioesterase [Alphaproteobacteria bacterium]MBL0718211.1 acyl-CoA thioesterase [Alphaproteobacteria bacterium]
MKHQFEFAIAFSDTDAQGIVYHARYLDITERARIVWFNKVVDYDEQFTSASMLRDKRGFVVVDAHCRYHKSIKYAEKIIVESTVSERSHRKLIVQHQFKSMDLKTLFHTQTIVLVFVDLKISKSIKMPEKLYKKFKHYCDNEQCKIDLL